MTMGIEQFRHITEQGALENRRVRLEGNEGHQELRAPNNLWGRFVDWIKGIGHKGVVAEKRTDNNEVRQAFYDALVKSEGPEFAELVIKTVTGKDGETFTAKGTNLQALRIKEILDTSDKLRVQYRRHNGTELGKYVRDNLGSVVNALSLSPNSSLSHSQLKPGDKDVERAFRELVVQNEGFSHRNFTKDDFDRFAIEAIDRACKAKEARFNEQFRNLSRTDLPYFHDTKTYFDTISTDLLDPETPLGMLGGDPDMQKGDFGNVSPELKSWFEDTIAGIEEAGKSLAKMEFDPRQTRELIESTQNTRDDLGRQLNPPPLDLRQAEFRVAMREVEDYCEGLQFDNEESRTDFVGIVNRVMQDGFAMLDETDSVLDGASRNQVLDHVAGQLSDHLKRQENPKIPDDQVGHIVGNFRIAMEERLTNSKDLQQLGQCRQQALALRDALVQEGRSQIDKLDGKIGYLYQYLTTDPMSEKAIAYDKLVAATTLQNALLKIMQALYEIASDEGSSEAEKNRAERDWKIIQNEIRDNYERIGTLKEQWRKASPSRLKGNDNPPQNELILTPEKLGLETDKQTGETLSNQDLLLDPNEILDPPKGDLGGDDLHRIQEVKDELVEPKLTLYDDDDVSGEGNRGEVESRPLGQLSNDGRVLGVNDQFDPKSVRAQIKQHRLEEVRSLKRVLDQCETKLPGMTNAGKLFDQLRPETVQQLQWTDKVSRDMVVTREGVTRTYRSEIIPNLSIGGALKHHRSHGTPNSLNMPGDDGQLIDEQPNQDNDDLVLDLDLDLNRPDPETLKRLRQAPNLEVSKLTLVDREDSDNNEVKSVIVRHGPLDVRGIKDETLRQEISTERAREVIIAGLGQAPTDFLERAGRSNPPFKLVHVNISLSNANPKGLERKEGSFIQEELDAFDAPELNGQVILPVEYSGNYLDDDNIESGVRGVTFDLENITFSFAVSGNRTQSTRFDEHDKQNLIKLVGDLGIGSRPGGFVGEVIDQLEAQREDDTLDEKDKQKIDDQIRKLKRDVDNARRMFNSGSYKVVQVDSYKMVRTVMRIVDLANDAMQTLLPNSNMRMLLSEGSQDMEGVSMGDVEHKSQVIIEDMGGRVMPGEKLSEPDQTIFNTVLTSSGQIERQQMVTGISGSSIVYESGSGNRGAIDYATGLNTPQRPRT